MATLREYYNADFSRLLSMDREQIVSVNGAELCRALIRLHCAHDANAFFASAFIPNNPYPLPVCEVVLGGIDAAIAEKDQVEIHSGHPGASPEEMLDSRSLRFTDRIFIYYDGELSTEQVREIESLVRARKRLPVVRSTRYLHQRTSYERPLAFISHDSRDKDLIARHIAVGLITRVCPVWYDEFSLKVGDRLRESIETGLKECQRCILIVSKNFLANDGWTKNEFDSVFTREILERRDVILPVWHGVTAQEVYEYSPTLANRFAINWAEGKDQVVAKLHGAIVAANAA
ncbi:MAG: toll/interleukin-1 receptor domain-containing protein [Thiobacillus sp.]|uniref:toll/interleukin-1 receptor domain-containing protein n=1 Tax=Thiobacillus sp. TaxID=924 RepID=UPI0028941201|nr:toll/interleukin-1 receptor domain-containing protein [Thiobacillus sp.]MDT3708290.1 toll/interleukin-1 receptor domain-containing protein [Thiobacillus sp.]